MIFDKASIEDQYDDSHDDWEDEVPSIDDEFDRLPQSCLELQEEIEVQGEDGISDDDL